MLFGFDDKTGANFKCSPTTQFEVEAPTATTNRVCATATTCNSTQYETAALTATTDRVCATVVPPCPGCLEYYESCNNNELLVCPVILGDRVIYNSPVTSLANPVLTRAEGDLNIRENIMLMSVDFASLSFVGGVLRFRENSILTQVDFASLSYVGGKLEIYSNPALTFASLHRLSHVQAQIYFCENEPSFVIPNAASGTAAPPGLTSVLYKGSTSTFCLFQNSSDSCAFVTCP